MNCLYNNKEAIESELDFYFPEFKLAIQINGISHYAPIYGDKKFASIQAMDIEKKIKCKELDIILYEIDCRNDSYINEKLLNTRWLEFEGILKNYITPK